MSHILYLTGKQTINHEERRDTDKEQENDHQVEKGT